MKKLTISAASGLAVFTPLLAAAQTEPQFEDLTTFLQGIVDFINGTLMPLLFAVIFLYFAWAMFNIFVKGQEDEGALKKGRTAAINSIIGVVLILSFWGIVNLFAAGFGLTGQGQLETPEIDITN